MIKGLPGGAVHQDIPGQATRVIGKPFTYIQNEAVGADRREVGAIARWLGHSIEGDDRFCSLATDPVTEILALLPLSIITIGREAIAKRTKRASFIVVTTQQPVVGVFVRIVDMEVDDAAGAQVMIDDVQDQVGAEGGIASDGVHL